MTPRQFHSRRRLQPTKITFFDHKRPIPKTDLIFNQILNYFFDQFFLGAEMSGLVKCLLGMGNPLLDIMADVDQAILDKYEVITGCHDQSRFLFRCTPYTR